MGGERLAQVALRHALDAQPLRRRHLLGRAVHAAQVGVAGLAGEMQQRAVAAAEIQHGGRSVCREVLLNQPPQRMGARR